MHHLQLHNKNWNPKHICLKNMFTSNEHSHGILHERWYYEVDKKRVLETAVQKAEHSWDGV